MYYYTACGNGIILMQSVQSGRQLIIKICISIYQYTVEVIKLTEIQLRLPNIAHHVRGWLFCLEMLTKAVWIFPPYLRVLIG